LSFSAKCYSAVLVGQGQDLAFGRLHHVHLDIRISEPYLGCAQLLRVAVNEQFYEPGLVVGDRFDVVRRAVHPTEPHVHSQAVDEPAEGQ
jgi:hypothetical protein